MTDVWCYDDRLNSMMFRPKSARAGEGTLLWDGRRVTNNEKANAFLDKEYRAGWNPFV